MKVLLVEPFSKGHTLTILAYTKRCLEQRGITFEVAAEFAPEELENGRLFLERIQSLAKNASADLIHVLTIDYLLKTLLRDVVLRPRPVPSGVPVVANLYNYNNLLYSLRSLIMRLMVSRRVPMAYFVSSSLLAGPDASTWQRRLSHFTPDPYDESEFIAPEKAVAIAKLRLNLSAQGRVFLVFGTLDSRKGFDRVISAFAGLSDGEWHLLCVGKRAREQESSPLAAEIEQLKKRGKLTLVEGYVDEASVGDYFGAADYVVTAYPRWYEISSGNLTRACAAGKPSVCADHGEVGLFVARMECGVTFDISRPPELIRALEQAIAATDQTYAGWSKRARHGAEGRNLASYGNALVDGYRRFLGQERA